MITGIALIRGINVGGKNMLPMALLRDLCESVGLCEARTLIQSGNVVFRAESKAFKKAAAALAGAIEKRCGFRPSVIVRTCDEVRAAVKANPLATIRGADKSRLLIMFLTEPPGAAAQRAVKAIKSRPERVVLIGSQAFLHYPKGIAETKLPMATVERALGVPGTCRNLNTVEKLLAMGAEMSDGKV